MILFRCDHKIFALLFACLTGTCRGSQAATRLWQHKIFGCVYTSKIPKGLYWLLICYTYWSGYGYDTIYFAEVITKITFHHLHSITYPINQCVQINSLIDNIPRWWCRKLWQHTAFYGSFREAVLQWLPWPLLDNSVLAVFAKVQDTFKEGRQLITKWARQQKPH